MNGKTIVVTGVASGIGAATAKSLQERGATIIGLDRNEPANSVDAYIPIDLADEGSIAQAIQQIGEATDGPIDALCNVAGVPPTVPPVLVLQVNFLGLRLFTEGVVPYLKEGGSIVNVASLAGMGWQTRVELCNQLFTVENLSDADAFCAEFNIDAENCYEFSKEAVM